MSETIITIDIATQLKAGIETAVKDIKQTSAADQVESAVTVHAKGVKSNALTRGDATVFPAVGIMVSEAMNHDGAQASKLRDYPVMIWCGTQFQDDPWQLTFYAIAQAVGKYLLAPPTLSLTLTSCKFNALSVPNQPEGMEADGQAGRLQLMKWNVIVRVQVT